MADEANSAPGPTWEVPIRSFFNAIDVNHMLKITQGDMDLADYDNVRSWGPRIYDRVARKTMPVPPSEVWTDAMIATFKAWMDSGYPRSAAEEQQP